MNIIIGNNSVILRNMLRDILTEAGHSVPCLTANGQEIIDIVKSSNIDLVILGENLSNTSEKDIIEILNIEAPLPIIHMGSDKTLGTTRPQKILPKPELDKMGESYYKEQLINEFSDAIEAFRRNHNAIKKAKPIKIEHIVIGSSTGGPNALKIVLDALPHNFPIPISIVQHMEEGHEEGLATWLNKTCKLNVRMAINRDIPKSGEIIMGEQGKHLSVKNKTFYYTDEDKVHYQKPAVDVLFSTAAKCYQKNLLGVLLTGMGRDGANGCLDIIQNGGKTIVQDETTSTVYGMPKAAVELNAASLILPIEKIAEYIIDAVKKGSL